MTKRLPFLLIALLLSMLVACSTPGATSVEPEPTDIPATTEEEVVEEAAEEPVEESTEAAAPEPTEEPEAVEEAAVEEEMSSEEVAAEAEAPTENLTDGCVENYAEGVDYFPQKAEVTHSAGFSLEYFDNYKVLTVNSPFPGAEETAVYVLVQCGTPAPAGYDDATVIETPINRIIAMSTTYLPYLDTFGEVDSLVGMDSTMFASNTAVREKIDAGEIVEVGFGAEVNVEQVLDSEPDVVMTYSSGSPDYDAHPKLEEAGITVVLNSDYLDTTPLGRAEWGKFIAALYNKDGEAQAWFDDIVADYESLVGLVSGVEERPTVFANTPYEGTWYMPGGQSYAGIQLADAGADFVWAEDESTETLFLDFETVYDQAADAQYWVNIGFFFTLEDLLAADERFADFAAYANGNVYNNDALTNEFGGNDFYESGAANPNVVLADLIKIFHPELLPDHDLVYYRVME